MESSHWAVKGRHTLDARMDVYSNWSVVPRCARTDAHRGLFTAARPIFRLGLHHKADTSTSTWKPPEGP